MRLQDFDFALPPELIAKRPPTERGNSRLLLVDREKRTWQEKLFNDITDIFDEQDLLVFNESKVIPARLRLEGNRELFLSEQIDERSWKCLVRPGKKFRQNNTAEFADGTRIIVRNIENDGLRLIEFDMNGKNFWEFLDAHGEVPLPPYIDRTADVEDKTRYQTIYANTPGSVAAPTADLHFSEELLAALKKGGIGVEFVTLHVGLGTFLPVKTENIAAHRMHAEMYEIEPDVAERINAAKTEGKKITAVGSTSLRTLESATDANRLVKSGSGKTDIFLYPPAAFQVVDHFLTNFHLPKSTLMMLVAAFADPDGTAGIELVRRVYTHAVRERFRFFSYGDASLWW